jgi:hypothetical protein
MKIVKNSKHTALTAIVVNLGKLAVVMLLRRGITTKWFKNLRKTDIIVKMTSI